MLNSNGFDKTGNVAVIFESGTLYIRTYTKGDKVGAIVQNVLTDSPEDLSTETFAGALLQAVGGHDGAEIGFSPIESTNPTITVNLISDEISVPDYCSLPREEYTHHFSNAKMMQKFHPERLQKRGRKPKASSEE